MHDVDNSIFFAPILPWQTDQWAQLTARYERLPHGLLFAGMTGIGKRAFVWQYVAWLLCENRADNMNQTVTMACGHCQSCQWLLAGTHPDLKVLPQSSLPVSDIEEDKTSKKKDKKTSSTSSKNNAAKPSKTDDTKVSIKVDDVRELQPFISQGSTGRRVCVIDNADMMTVAAANALLKTLEEPRQGVHLFLISDIPTKLLPTIRSRVQKIPIDQISPEGIHSYLADYIVNQSNNEQENDIQAISTTGNNPKNHAFFTGLKEDENTLNTHIDQALKLANGAPLSALSILSSTWYQHRETWLKTWLALRAGKRSSIAASDYWQTVLTLTDFIVLSETVLMDMNRCLLGLPPLQADLKLQSYDAIKQLTLTDTQRVLSLIEDIKRSVQQNVQDKLGYDRLMSSLQHL